MIDLTPALRIYGRCRRRRLNAAKAAESQARVLMRLCRQARGTRFGREHGFAGIRSVADFQERAPLRGYGEFWTSYWQPAFPVLRDCTWPGTIPYFARTSGTTTGATKYIPYTAEMARDAALGMLELFAHHLHGHPSSRVFGGMGLLLGGDITLEEHAPGIRSGAVSGITAERMPRWLRPRVLPSREIAGIPDWSEKIARLAAASLGQDIRVLGGSPNWLLLFFEQLARLSRGADRRLAAWYPDLELVVHGGVNFAPYRSRFRAHLEGGRAETREAYSTSEGFFAVADRGDGEGMRLIADRGVFYEFVPVGELDKPNPARHWAATVAPGVDYAIYVSTCAGLWAYGLGDTVRLVDTEPIRLVITGRTSYLLSAFGEHVIEEELAQAVTEAAGAIGTDIADYTVTPVMGGDSRATGRHHYIVECARPVTAATEIDAFIARLDSCLQRLNADYREHRERDVSLRRPTVAFAPPGAFAAWMQQRGRAGGQNKVPRILHDAELFADLKSFVEAR